MKVILVGAGRGQRLMPLTEHQPKTFTTIAGKRIIDWTLEAFRSNGLDDFVFIGGYAIDTVRESLPNLEIVENRNWADNNILFSLLHAREYLASGFYAAYTDTLFRSDAVAALRASPHDITLVMDTRWRERYRFRSQHPEVDAEKLKAVDGRVTRISRHIDSAEASGEFTGVMRMTARGAGQFVDYFDELHDRHGDHGLFADGRPFRMSYLIHQLDSMISSGIEVHCVGVPGQYHEIDTLEDYDLARQDWTLSAGT